MSVGKIKLPICAPEVDRAAGVRKQMITFLAFGYVQDLTNVEIATSVCMLSNHCDLLTFM